MSLEISGKVFKLLTEQSGSSARGEWKKREFILETKEAYPKKVCISCWNERVDDLKNLKIGQDIKVSINVESREYNEKWYTDVRAWKIEADTGNSAGSSSMEDEVFSANNNQEESQEIDDLPF